MLRPHISRIKKLKFESCTFEPKNIFSRIMHKITHLSLVDLYGAPNSIELCNIGVMKCRKLIKLEVGGLYDAFNRTFEQITHNNPGLQSIFYRSLGIDLFQSNPISGHLSQLKEVEELCFQTKTRMQSDEIDRIIHTLRNLELLGIFCRYNDSGLLQRFGLECKKIKRLKLVLYSVDKTFNLDDEIIQAVRSFQQIEYLRLEGDHLEIDKIGMIVQCLPHLRHLSFEIGEFQFNKILSILRECPSLETITITECCRLNFGRLNRLFDEFLETIAVTGQTSARIEIESDDTIFATITSNGIVCRNKLMHWEGCETIREPLDINLLDLAYQIVKSDGGNIKCQENVMDWIFDYLDLASLYFFAETNPRCKQSVENYIKMHSKQNGLFTMTNEFHPFSCNGEMHRMFTPHVTNLKVYNCYGFELDNTFLCSYNHLTKVAIYDEIISGWCIPKSVRHVILDGSEFINSSELAEWANGQDIEILELKNASSFNGEDYDTEDLDGYCEFTKVKTCIFNYRSETQFKHIQRMFQGSKTTLVPIFSNSNQF